MVPVLQKLGADVAAITKRAQDAVAGLPAVSGSDEPDIRPSKSFIATIQRAEKEMGALGDEYISTEHLLLALTDDSSGVADVLPDRATLMKAVCGGPRATPRDLPHARGPVPGAREVRRRPHQGGRGRQARPGDRPRRGDPSRRPGALAADQEQPGPDRRPGRRQDRDRRGPRPADRRRGRPRVAPRPAPGLARPRRPARRREVPRRVRGAAEGRAQGGPGGGGRDRHVHRRAAHDRRRGRRRGRGRRRQPAEADARPRRAAAGRCDDARRVPQAHREGRRARAALRPRLRRRARHRRHDRDPARAKGALRGPPRRPHRRLGDRRRGDPLRALHPRPLPSRQGDRPDRRGRLAAEDGDRVDADRDRRGRAAHPAARDRAPGARQGEGQGFEGAPSRDRGRARRARRALERDEGPLAEREGRDRGDQAREGRARRVPPRGGARRARCRPAACRRASLRPHPRARVGARGARGPHARAARRRDDDADRGGHRGRRRRDRRQVDRDPGLAAAWRARSRS